MYVDLYFLINFSMDFLCFFLTSRILRGPIRLPRMAIGAALGGLYADLALFLPLTGAAALGLDLLAAAAICLITYGKRGEGRSLPVHVLVYTAVSMTLGGFMTAFFHLLRRSEWLSSTTGVESDGISVWLFALLAAISGLVTLLGGKFFTRQSARPWARVSLYYGGRCVRLDGMTDTGNLLREPIGGKPCLLADAEALRPLLPEEILSAALSTGAVALDRMPREYARHLRLVPAKTASGEGLLVAVKMERITVNRGGGEREIDAMVALCRLGKSAAGYSVLLPAELLNV